MSDFNIEVRKAKLPQDEAFILATWLRNYKHSSYFAKRIPHKIFFNWHHKVATHILQRPTTHVLVAHLSGDPDILFGYLVFERIGPDTVIHYAFVKREFRNMGIGRSLLLESCIDMDKAFFTHWTFKPKPNFDVASNNAEYGKSDKGIGSDQIIEKFPKLTYDPYRI